MKTDGDLPLHVSASKVFSSKGKVCACLSVCLCVKMKECVLNMGEDEENLIFSPDSSSGITIRRDRRGRLPS